MDWKGMALRHSNVPTSRKAMPCTVQLGLQVCHYGRKVPCVHMHYNVDMPTQDHESLGRALKRAIKAAGSSQADIARHLGIDAGQVSRWANDKAVPHAETVRKISDFLKEDLSASFAASVPHYELYVSAPISGLGIEGVSKHHEVVARIVASLSVHVNSYYWPGSDVRELSDLIAPDLATERNLEVLQGCHALLYLQFEEIYSPVGRAHRTGFGLGTKAQDYAGGSS